MSGSELRIDALDNTSPLSVDPRFRSPGNRAVRQPAAASRVFRFLLLSPINRVLRVRDSSCAVRPAMASPPIAT